MSPCQQATLRLRLLTVIALFLSLFLSMAQIAFANGSSGGNGSVDRLRDKPLVFYFPEAQGAPSATLDVNQVLHGTDLDHPHIETFEKDFDSYLKAEIAQGGLPASSLSWWKDNREIFLKKGFMNTPGATVESLADGIGRALRQIDLSDNSQEPVQHGFLYQNTLGQLPPGVRADVGAAWLYVIAYGGWVAAASVPFLKPIWDYGLHPITKVAQQALVNGPIASTVTLTLQNWIRGPQEDLMTVSSKLKNDLEKALKKIKKGKRAEANIVEAEVLVQALRDYKNKIQTIMNAYDVANLTPEEADANYDIVMGQAKMAFHSLTESIAPYLREGRALLFDAKQRPMTFASSIATFNNQRFSARTGLDRKTEQLLQAGISQDILNDLQKRNRGVFQLEQDGHESVPGTGRALLLDLETTIADLHPGTKNLLEEFLEYDTVEQLSRRQIVATMAAWYDHDIRFPELNRNLDGVSATMAATMKREFGFPVYLRMPGVQKDMKALLRQFGLKLDGQLDDMRQMVEVRREELGLPPRAAETTPAASCITKGLAARFSWVLKPFSRK
jgi:hypothetical protein